MASSRHGSHPCRNDEIPIQLLNYELLIVIKYIFSIKRYLKVDSKCKFFLTKKLLNKENNQIFVPVFNKGRHQN